LDLAAINGDATLYDQYVAHMKQAKSPDVYLHYLAALARFTKPELEQRSLELAISSDIRPQDMYYLLAPAIFIPDTQKTAWDFMKSHWDTVVNRAGGMGEGGPRLTFVASAFCDENSIHEVKQFLDEHVKGAGRPLQQSLDRANDCVRLKQQQAPKLAEYLSGQSATAAR
jgi:aminopeptidase N